MDFKNILQSLTSLSEGETKDTGKGRVHKGDYGTSYDGDDEKKAKKPEVKRGRGRPKKDADASGEVKKYDTKGLHGVFGGGQKPKKDVGKVSKKHSLKEYIEEVADNKEQLDEADQVTIAPAQQNTQVIKQGSKVLGTVTNPQLAAQIKQSIGKGEMALNPDGEMQEGFGDVAKKVGSAVKAGAKAVGKAIVGKDDAELLRDLQKSAGVRGMNHGKPSMAISDVEKRMEEEVDMGQYDAVKSTPSKHDDDDVFKKFREKVRQYGDELDQRQKEKTQKSEKVDEVSQELATKTYAKRTADAWERGDMATGPEDHEAAEKASDKAQKTWHRIGHRWGEKGQIKADKAADKELFGDRTDEVAPPGAKAERMVKHIKASYAKDGKLSPKEKSIAYATAWKAHNKGKVEESFVYEGVVLTEGAMKDLVINLLNDLEQGPRGYNINPAVEVKDKAMAQRIIDKTLAHGERYKRLAGTLKSQLRDAALEEFGFVNYDQSLEEANTDPEFDMPIADTVVPEKKPSIFVKAKPVVSKPMGMLSSLKKPEQSLNPFESKDMKDIQLEGWEQQLSSLLTEGITVTSSTGQQGMPDSVSINATDADAQELLAIVRQAGLGVFGGQEQPTSNYGAPMDPHAAEPTGTGTAPEVSPEVVGDDGDMLALIKKMSGLSSSEETSDYEDEEGADDTALQPADSEEEDHDSEDSGEDTDREEETTEGNAFTGALAKAKSDGVQPGEKMKVGGKQYPVKEDDVEEGNKFTGNLAKARAAGKDQADLDGDGDMEKVHEGEHTCEGCGMHESDCGCEEQVEEGFSNDVGGDAMADTEMAKLKALLAMGNDLHKMKSSNTVGNPTQVSVRESIDEWKKLSGIK